jgi:hypothetical protein
MFWSAAEAIDLLKGVMPGEVSRLHEKYEGRCLDCHTLVQKRFNDKCNACHKEVKADVERQAGFHGRIDSGRCEICHAEHKGRQNTLIVFKPKEFDHRQSDFDLTGKHRDVECAKCHTKPKYREAASDCFSCHRKDDIHKESLGRRCDRCHTAESWKEVRFDHEKTRFRLEGKHREVKCEGCHASPDFKSTPMTCIGCHKKDDKHKGILGQNCAQCHTAKIWIEILFDHDKTRFRLVESHKKTACLKCHTTPALKSAPRDCYGCHKKEDRHKGKLGQQCGRCHFETRWKEIRFDHSTTRYPLLGRHIPVPCLKCHAQERWKIPTQCSSCHTKDDQHKGRLGETCENCHTETSWKDAKQFDHQKTDFPLLGKHVEAKCSGCHKTLLFKDAPTVCYDCHEKEDYHKGRYGKKCGAPCHTEEDWKRARFDHAEETGYSLLGKHGPVKCDLCHLKPLFTARTSRLCFSCHRKDDEHRGELGPRCELCHSEAGFEVIKPLR